LRCRRSWIASRGVIPRDFRIVCNDDIDDDDDDDNDKQGRGKVSVTPAGGSRPLQAAQRSDAPTERPFRRSCC
jgi:hypothetical protein